MSEIFPETVEPAVLYTKNLANPVHVQSADTGAKYDRRPYVRLDLIALANAIVKVERENTEIAKELANALIVIENQRIALERLSTVVTSPSVWRLLTTLAKSDQFEADEDPEDRY
jgi:hypothetical protein